MWSVVSAESAPTPTRLRPRRTSARSPTASASRNRKAWGGFADWFEETHGAQLARYGGMAWTSFRVPESRLRMLGDVRGKDILELGCGAARWSIALVNAGARVVGLDVTPRRLEQARELARRAGVNLKLIESGAESVPLPDRSFDIIFCDIGAMSFADPYRTVPEARRLLRVGGRLVFSTESPLRWVFWDARRDRLSVRPQRPYFGLHRVDLGKHEKTVEFNLPYGEWIRLFRENGFEVERMLELPFPARGSSSFLRPSDVRWARQWPWETIWSVRKTGGHGARTPRPSSRRQASR